MSKYLVLLVLGIIAIEILMPVIWVFTFFKNYSDLDWIREAEK